MVPGSGEPEGKDPCPQPGVGGEVGAEGEGQVDSVLSAEPDAGLDLLIPEITTGAQTRSRMLN